MTVSSPSHSTSHLNNPSVMALPCTCKTQRPAVYVCFSVQPYSSSTFPAAQRSLHLMHNQQHPSSCTSPSFKRFQPFYVQNVWSQFLMFSPNRFQSSMILLSCHYVSAVSRTAISIKSSSILFIRLNVSTAFSSARVHEEQRFIPSTKRPAMHLCSVCNVQLQTVQSFFPAIYISFSLH